MNGRILSNQFKILKKMKNMYPFKIILNIKQMDRTGIGHNGSKSILNQPAQIAHFNNSNLPPHVDKLFFSFWL